MSSPMIWSLFSSILLMLMVLRSSHAEGDLSPVAQEWLHIDDSVMWIYSSFWEHRVREGEEFGQNTMGPAPYIRVMMIGPFNEQFPQILKQSSCEYFFEELHTDTIHSRVLAVYVPRNDDIYPENLSRPYIVYCEAPRDLSRFVPKALAFNLLDFKKKSWSKDMSGSSRKWLIPIKGDPFRMHIPYSPEKKIMGCIKPIHGGPFVDIPMLVNFLVGHHVMGLQHFVLYDAGDGSPKMYKILNMARKAGLSIEMRTWNLREHHGWMLTQTIHGEACMHDAMGLGYENVLTIDYDELLVPHADINGQKSPTYSEMINALDKEHPSAAYYRFPNVFYVPGPGADHEFLIALRMTRHLSPSPNGARTKCIYKPHRMSQVYTHFGVPLNSSFVEVAVPAEYGAVHHYRRHPPPGGFHKSEQYDDMTVKARYAEKIKASPVYQALEQALRGHNPSLATR